MSDRLLGKRYTPELNFDLEIAKIFDGLARDYRFEEQINSRFDELSNNFRRSKSALKKEFLEGKGDKTIQEFEELKKAYKKIDFSGVHKIDFDTIIVHCEHLLELIDVCTELYHQEKEKLKEKEDSDPSLTFRNELHYLYRLSSTINSFINFLSSTTCRLINDPVLILTGEAGIGKSHMLADIVNKRLKRGHLSLFLLGQHFTKELHPWAQIINNLSRLHINEDEFLEALNSKAQVKGSRILIVIDALNEGAGHKIWKNHLLEFIKTIKKFKWLGLVVSIRTTYEQLIAPRDIISSEIAARVKHYGFADHEYEASKLFFENYGINQASTPLLHPEFRNPLFLKLFCEGLQKKGLTEVPSGLNGITNILNFYLQAINDKLAEKHNYSANINLVQRTVEHFAYQIAKEDNALIKIDDAYDIIFENDYSRLLNDKKEYLHDLINEGVFYKDLVWKEENGVDTIRFAYERFGDHLVASILISEYLNFKNPVKSFRPKKEII